MNTYKRENDYREPDELMIPSKNGFIIIPTDTIRVQEAPVQRAERGYSKWNALKYKNILQFTLMLTGMIALLAYIGFAIAGMLGLFVISAVAVIGFITLSNTRIESLLRGRQIRSIEYADASALYAMVEELAKKAGLEKVPRLFLDGKATVNAYTVEDKTRSAIVLSEALLSSLNRREIKGVLAHEIAHLKNRDIGILYFSDQIQRLTGYMAIAGQILLVLYLPLMILNQMTVPWTLLMILIAAPTVSMLFRIALSRNREFKADMDAVTLAGDAVGLASALNKINVQTNFWQRMYAPYLKSVPELLRTHPNTPARIRRLKIIQNERDHDLAWNT